MIVLDWPWSYTFLTKKDGASWKPYANRWKGDEFHYKYGDYYWPVFEQHIFKSCKQRRWGSKIKRQKYWSHPAALCFNTSFTFTSLSQWQPAQTAWTFFSVLWLLLYARSFCKEWWGRHPTFFKAEQNHGILLKYIHVAPWLNKSNLIVHRYILILMIEYFPILIFFLGFFQ